MSRPFTDDRDRRWRIAAALAGRGAASSRGSTTARVTPQPAGSPFAPSFRSLVARAAGRRVDRLHRAGRRRRADDVLLQFGTTFVDGSASRGGLLRRVPASRTRRAHDAHVAEAAPATAGVDQARRVRPDGRPVRVADRSGRTRPGVLGRLRARRRRPARSLARERPPRRQHRAARVTSSTARRLRRTNHATARSARSRCTGTRRRTRRSSGSSPQDNRRASARR